MYQGLGGSKVMSGAPPMLQNNSNCKSLLLITHHGMVASVAGLVSSWTCALVSRALAVSSVIPHTHTCMIPSTRWTCATGVRRGCTWRMQAGQHTKKDTQRGSWT